jgi:hypothetical protein
VVAEVLLALMVLLEALAVVEQEALQLLLEEQEILQAHLRHKEIMVQTVIVQQIMVAVAEEAHRL